MYTSLMLPINAALFLGTYGLCSKNDYVEPASLIVVIGVMSP